MKKYLFVGDVFIIDLGTQKMFTPLSANPPKITYAENKTLLPRLRQTKIPARLVSDGKGAFYHAIYVESTLLVDGVASRTITIEELISKSIKYTGDICEFLKKLPTITFIKDKEYKYLPVIVAYKNGYWENISTAPIKAVKNYTDLYIYEGSLGILRTDYETKPLRPYITDILANPSSLIMAKECGIDLSVKSDKKKEKKNVTTLMSLFRKK